MIIINADDWGRSRGETDAALACYNKGRITSVTAMMFMEDSERAAELAKSAGMDVGLHLNLSQPFGRPPASREAAAAHERIVRFLTTNRYSLLLYHPALRDAFRVDFESQWNEFQRLYGRRPSHVDGHQHKHLCSNMLLDRVIPRGEKIRRNFSFWPGEKSWLNRLYRSLLDRQLQRRYRLADYLFSLTQCLQGRRLDRVKGLAQRACVELEAHPIYEAEYRYLLGEEHARFLDGLKLGTYAQI